jgi:hypothetical protein
VPDNVREGASVARFGAALKWLDGKCHRKYTAAGRVSETVRAVLLQPDARVKQAQAVAEPLDLSEWRKPIPLLSRTQRQSRRKPAKPEMFDCCGKGEKVR